MVKKNSLSSKLSVMAIQMNSTENKEKNFDQVNQWLKKIKKNEVDLVVLPEVFNFRSSTKFKKESAETLTGETITWLKETAKKFQVNIIAGSFTEIGKNEKVYNTSVAVNSKGELMGTYRKIHLFDIKLKNKSIKESNHFLAGNLPKVIDVNGWKIGLSICYDLRFPELYRHYFSLGADIIVIPSSFTTETGQKHWKILCQARAIENQCYIIAPNQCGVGANDVPTYGHSMIIDPDGKILEEANQSDIISLKSSLSKEIVDQTRSKLPTKKHQKKSLFL